MDFEQSGLTRAFVISGSSEKRHLMCQVLQTKTGIDMCRSFNDEKNQRTGLVFGSQESIEAVKSFDDVSAFAGDKTIDPRDVVGFWEIDKGKRTGLIEADSWKITII